MKKLVLDKTLESQSKYGEPYEKSRNWYFKDNLGNFGVLRASTEMEALDRLREAFEEVGSIKWITKTEYDLN